MFQLLDSASVISPKGSTCARVFEKGKCKDDDFSTCKRRGEEVGFTARSTEIQKYMSFSSISD
jgi:hypothetical protein